MFLNRPLFSALTLVPFILLSACGGNTTTQSSVANEAAPKGSLVVSVTDAPVDGAAKVVLQFTAVSVKGADGKVTEFKFEKAKSIDLLKLQGSTSEVLLGGNALVAGKYEWIRLDVTAKKDSIIDSYVELTDGTQIELDIPSIDEAGLKIVGGFTVEAGKESNFTIDFDLRKSLLMGKNHLVEGAKLRPTLRMVDTKKAGHIEGEIDPNLIAEHCKNASLDAGSVYVYAENTDPEDVSGDVTKDPIANGKVKFDKGGYRFEVGFLPEASYKIAFTCDTDKDDPEQADDVKFIGKDDHIRVTPRTKSNAPFVHGIDKPFVKGPKFDCDWTKSSASSVTASSVVAVSSSAAATSSATATPNGMSQEMADKLKDCKKPVTSSAASSEKSSRSSIEWSSRSSVALSSRSSVALSSHSSLAWSSRSSVEKSSRSSLVWSSRSSSSSSAAASVVPTK